MQEVGSRTAGAAFSNDGTAPFLRARHGRCLELRSLPLLPPGWLWSSALGYWGRPCAVRLNFCSAMTPLPCVGIRGGGFACIHSPAQPFVEPSARVVETLDVALEEPAAEVVFLHRNDLLLEQRVQRS